MGPVGPSKGNANNQLVKLVSLKATFMLRQRNFGGNFH